MRGPWQQTCWSERPSLEWHAGLRCTCQCVDLYGQPTTTVDSRDNPVLYGAHAVQKAIQFSVRSTSDINGYRTAPNTPPNTM
jgi:hypothetical protein